MPLIHDKRVSETSPVSSALRSFFSHFDPMQLIPMLVLLTFGIVFVYGTGQQVGGVHARPGHCQLQPFAVYFHLLSPPKLVRLVLAKS